MARHFVIRLEKTTISILQSDSIAFQLECLNEGWEGPRDKELNPTNIHVSLEVDPSPVKP